MEWIAFTLISVIFIWLYLHDRKITSLDKQDLNLYVEVHIDGKGEVTQTISKDLEKELKGAKKASTEIPIEATEIKTNNWLDKKPKDSNF